MPLYNPPGITGGPLVTGEIPFTTAASYRSYPDVVNGNLDFFWENTTERLGVGLAGVTPSARAHVVGDGEPAARPLALRADGTDTVQGEVFFGDIADTTYGTEKTYFEVCAPGFAGTRSRGFRFSDGPHTTIAGGELQSFVVSPANVQFSSGTTLALQRSVSIGAPTYSATSAKTVTEGATLAVAAPVAGTNVTWGKTLSQSQVYGIKVTGYGGIHVTVSGAGTSALTPASAIDICYTAGSITSLASGQEYRAIFGGVQSGTAVLQWAGATGLTYQRWIHFDAPTLSFTGTLAVAATLSISGSPTATAGAITDSYGIWVASDAGAGNVRFDGSLRVGDNASMGTRAFTLSGSNAGNVMAIRNTLNTANSGITIYDSSSVGQGSISWNNASAATLPGTFVINSTSGQISIVSNNSTVMQAFAASSNTPVGATIFGNSSTFTAGRFMQISPPVGTTGSPTALYIAGAAHTTLSNAEASDVKLALARTVQFGQNTTLALQRAVLITAPTYSASAATKTITVAATFVVDGAPAAGTNAAITDSYAAIFGAKIRIDSAAAISGAVPATLGLTGGGTGPATAAQNEWIQIDTQNGRRWVPAWA